MALTDIKVRTAKSTGKQYKLTDENGMHLPVSVKILASAVPLRREAKDAGFRRIS